MTVLMREPPRLTGRPRQGDGDGSVQVHHLFDVKRGARSLCSQSLHRDA